MLRIIVMHERKTARESKGSKLLSNISWCPLFDEEYAASRVKHGHTVTESPACLFVGIMH